MVQSVRSNASGQYRFKSLDSGKYKVRVRKEGFAAQEVEACRSASALVDGPFPRVKGSRPHEHDRPRAAPQ